LLKKIGKIAYTLLYAFLIYTTTFLFIAFFMICSDLISDWKKSDMVKVFPDKVEITGTSKVEKNEVLLISGLDQEKSWFEIDERKIESYLMSNGWIKNATVKKIFPDSVSVTIVEYKPALIVNSRKKSEINGEEKDMFTMWFADSEGIVFKKAFPGETDGSLSFFHIDYDSVGPELREEKIKTAVSITDSWKQCSGICSIKSIKFDVTGGFIADCEGAGSLRSAINFGKVLDIAEIDEMKNLFMNIASKFLNENKWAGEYIFEKTEKDKKIRVIVGKVFQNIKRGSDA